MRGKLVRTTVADTKAPVPGPVRNFVCGEAKLS